MFAKVFEQIFDSSIAQDYTIRHMFIDLLILADPTGAVDMTYDAISRRTNVPEETIRRCIVNLCQPDVNSRSPLEDGKRLIPLDSHRDWGWKIVNYHHYRRIRDQEVRRSYFRDYQRKRRKKLKNVKDNKVNIGDNVELSSSSSTCTVEEIYQAYPRKVGKPHALRAIQKALTKIPFDRLLSLTKAYTEARNGDLAFVPNPATWFNEERFNDHPSTWVNQKPLPVEIEKPKEPAPRGAAYRLFDPNE